MGSTEVMPLRREQLNQAAAAVAAAFRDDPVYASLLPDPKRRPDALRAFMRMPLNDAIPFGSAYAAVAGAEVIGAAAWLPPGGYPWSGRRKLRSSVGMLKVARHARGAIRDLAAALGGATERAFPADPVWYLEVVGIRPDRQGGGVGAALLAPGLAAADAAVEPCYLETASTPQCRLLRASWLSGRARRRAAGAARADALDDAPGTRLTGPAIGSVSRAGRARRRCGGGGADGENGREPVGRDV